jgi:hypothetical protein
MTDEVASLVGEELLAPAPPQAVAYAARLAALFDAPLAVLFYGSILRTGDLDGVMDFYVLTQASDPVCAAWPRGCCGPTSAITSWRSMVRCCGPRWRP